MRAAVVALPLLLLPACATGPGPGAALDPQLVELMRDGKNVGGIKMRTDKKGRVTKMAVYHADETALPAWVRGNAIEKWPGAKVRSYETEWYTDVGRVYEVEVETADGTHCELSVTASGTERYTECEIAVDKLPEPVAAAVAKALPGGEVEEAEKKDGPGIDEVSLEVEANGREYYMVIRSDGKVLKHLVRLPTILEVPVK